MIENPTDARGIFLVRLTTGEYTVNNPAADDPTVRWWHFRSVAESWRTEYAPNAAVIQVTEQEREAINQSMRPFR